MGRMESCDVCGGDLAGDDIVRAELSFGEGAMCPSPMTMHKACHEQAAGLWKPDTESTCVVDTKYPETAKWTPNAIEQGMSFESGNKEGASGPNLK